jgi:hypothetical protein
MNLPPHPPRSPQLHTVVNEPATADALVPYTPVERSERDHLLWVLETWWTGSSQQIDGALAFHVSQKLNLAFGRTTHKQRPDRDYIGVVNPSARPAGSAWSDGTTLQSAVAYCGRPVGR